MSGWLRRLAVALVLAGAAGTGLVLSAQPFALTTPVRVVPETLPFPPFAPAAR